MNNYKILILYIVFLFSCSSNNTLVGVWNYSETRNYKGEKIDSYREKFGEVNASGPQIVFKKNGTYQKIFRPQKIDSGNWRFNKKLMSIEYDLLIDSSDWVGRSLIEKGLAIKYDDGLYYERLEDKVIELKRGHLVLDSRGNQTVYRKSD